MGNRVIESSIDEESVLTNCVVINSTIIKSGLKNCTVINSEVTESDCRESYFNDSVIEENNIIEKTYCNNGVIKRTTDIVRCHIDGDENKVNITGGGRPVVLTRCWFTNNAKVVGGDAWNSHFGENSMIDNCDIVDSELKDITVSRRIIENNVVGDYELPISENLVVIEIDDEDI